MRREEINIEEKQKRTHMVVDIGKLIKWINSITATKSSIRHASYISVTKFSNDTLYICHSWQATGLSTCVRGH